jgi:hypothetical protein
MSASWPAWTQDNLAAKPLHIHPFEYLSQQPYNSISRWTATSIKGAVLTAVITAPYEVYAAQAPKIQAFGERLVLSQHLQWLIGSAPKPKNFPSSFVYHYNGEDYHVYIVRRGPNKQEFIIAYTIRGEDDDAEIYWGVRDDRSCPLTR